MFEWCVSRVEVVPPRSDRSEERPDRRGSGRTGVKSARPAYRSGSRMSGPIDTALLLGAAVLLVSVVAVRLSTRAGLPSLLVYLFLGIAIGESGLGIQFEDAELTRMLGFCALVVIIAEGGLTTRWQVVRPVIGPGGHAGHARRLRQRGRGRRRHPSAPRPAVGAGPAVRRRALVDGRGGRVLHAAAAADPAPAAGDAGGRVRHQRRAGGAAGGGSVDDGGARPRGPVVATGAADRVRAGRRARSSVSLSGSSARSDCAASRCPRRASTRSPRSGSPCSRTPSVRWLTPPDSWRSTSPAWSSATPGSRTARRCSGFADGLAWLAQIGLFVLLGLLASPGSAAGRGAAGTDRGRGAGAARPADLGRGQRVVVRFRLARPGVPVVGRAAGGGADRARHDPAVARTCRAPRRCSTSSSSSS